MKPDLRYPPVVWNGQEFVQKAYLLRLDTGVEKFEPSPTQVALMRAEKDQPPTYVELPLDAPLPPPEHRPDLRYPPVVWDGKKWVRRYYPPIDPAVLAYKKQLDEKVAVAAFSSGWVFTVGW